MPMQQNGLAKLIEEMGEALQVAGKLTQYPHHQAPLYPGIHPDGTHLRTRLEEELGDVLGILQFVTNKMQLDYNVMINRADAKIKLFAEWDKEV